MMLFLTKTLKKGDLVFKEGMIADGFYIVVNGSFKNTFKRTNSGKNLQSTIKKMIILVPGSSYLGQEGLEQ